MHLRVDPDLYDKRDGRVSLCHFAEDDLVVAGCVSDPPSSVRIRDGAVPVLDEEAILQRQKWSHTAYLRASAHLKVLRKHSAQQDEALARKHLEIDELKAKLALCEERLASAGAAKVQAAAASDDSREASGQPRRVVVDYHILDGISEENATALCGLPSSEVLAVSGVRTPFFLSDNSSSTAVEHVCDAAIVFASSSVVGLGKG